MRGHLLKQGLQRRYARLAQRRLNTVRITWKTSGDRSCIDKTQRSQALGPQSGADLTPLRCSCLIFRRIGYCCRARSGS